MYLYHSTVFLDKTVEFAAKSRPGWYYCTGCYRARTKYPNAHLPATVAAKIENNKFVTDPDVETHYCVQYNEAKTSKIRAKHHNRKSSQDVKQSGKRPKQAHIEALADIPVKFADLPGNIREEIEGEMPTLRSSKSAYSRSRRKSIPVIKSIHNIPEHFERTLRGAEASEEDPWLGERFLLFRSAMRECNVFICDGNFKFNPPEFYQLYTIHALAFGEAVPVVYSLLPVYPENQVKSMGKCWRFCDQRSIIDSVVT